MQTAGTTEQKYITVERTASGEYRMSVGERTLPADVVAGRDCLTLTMQSGPTAGVKALAFPGRGELVSGERFTVPVQECEKVYVCCGRR